MIVEAGNGQRSHTDSARDIRNARVRIRIIASNPTRRKDPTSAMYSALCIVSAFCLWLVSDWQRIEPALHGTYRVCLHVQTAKKGYRRHALCLRVQIYKKEVDMYKGAGEEGGDAAEGLSREGNRRCCIP